MPARSLSTINLTQLKPAPIVDVIVGDKCWFDCVSVQKLMGTLNDQLVARSEIQET